MAISSHTAQSGFESFKHLPSTPEFIGRSADSVLRTCFMPQLSFVFESQTNPNDGEAQGASASSRPLTDSCDNHRSPENDDSSTATESSCGSSVCVVEDTPVERVDPIAVTTEMEAQEDDEFKLDDYL